MPKKYYAVRVGREVGIFESWKECQKQVKGFSNAEFRSFNTKKDAEKWLKIDESSDEDDDVVVKVFTDGGCKKNGKHDAVSGIGVFFSDDDPRNFSGKIYGKQTNNTAEIKAILKAYKILKEEIESDERVNIYSDSIYAIRAATEYGEKMEKDDWIKNIPNKHLVKKIYNTFKGRDNVHFIHVKAHTGRNDPISLGNEGADELATRALGGDEIEF
jgi:ribonuclease HI